MSEFAQSPLRAVGEGVIEVVKEPAAYCRATPEPSTSVPSRRAAEYQRQASPGVSVVVPPVSEADSRSLEAARSRRPSNPNVSIVVPALNEADNVGVVLSRIPETAFEVILVDGWSSDATIERARAARPGLRVFRQNRYGKGNALACGFAASRGDIIVMLDADGSADPDEIPRFVAALLGGADFAKGTRFAAGGSSDDITVVRRSGNWCLNRLVDVLYRTRSTDLCYGYMAFWADCLPTLAVAENGYQVSGEPGRSVPTTDPRPPRSEVMRWGDGFEIETLITVRAAARELRIGEVGSFEGRRLHGVSNLNAFSDGWRVLRTIAAENHRLRRTGGAVKDEVGAALAPAPLTHQNTITAEGAEVEAAVKFGDVGPVIIIDEESATLGPVDSSTASGWSGA